MNRKLLALLVTIFVLIATYLPIQFLAEEKKDTPEAVKGILDLRKWSFQDNDIIPLDGEWELYRDQLLVGMETNAERSSLPAPEIVSVPGNWSERNRSPLGKATFRLGIMVQEKNKIFGLKTSNIQISNRIIINGKVVGESGNPADRPSYVAKIKPYVTYFELNPGYNEVLIQVANFEYSVSGGINSSIYLGLNGDIAKLKERANAHGWVTIGAYILLGLYFVGLYSQRREDRPLLMLGIVGMSLALYSSATGERLIFDLFPDMPFWLYIRLQLLSVLTASIAMLLFVHLAFREFSSKTVIQVGLVINGLLIMSIIAGVFWLYYEMFIILYIAIELSLLSSAYVFIYAAFHRVRGSIYLAITAVALNMYVTIQSFANFGNFPQYRILPFEPFLILLMLALYMSLKFSNSFKKIEELSVQLLKMDKLKDEFISRTSHEFKTPLHGVMNIAASLLDDPVQTLTLKQREKLKLMTSITGRLSQLVLDILDISKLKQGQLTVDPEPLDVRSTVELLLQIFSYLREERNIRLVNAVPEQLKSVLADENRFRQIISNLLDNALKYTQEGFIEVSACELGDMIEITVIDSGRGMDEQEISRIFEPFTTLDMQHGDSFGLGLTIVKQLVELHQGSISVVSEVGQGSTFIVRLPSAGENSKAIAKYTDGGRFAVIPEYTLETPHFANLQGTYTILVADDHYSNLKILIDALESLNYKVIAVKNGAEAAKQIKENKKIDMAILDLMMPEMSGYEVCQLIRKTYSLLELPVLMVTAAIEAQDKLAAFEAGANDFLPKPFDLTELKARIRGLLAMKESFGKAINMEMAFLQSQIKPHFLFNVLHSIVALSYTDINKSRILTNSLADYLRGSFQFFNTLKRIPFTMELGLIHSYIDIEQMRFKDRIRVEYDIADEVLQLSIPPLLLQPLVENAIRHGLGGRIEGGTVRITARVTGKYYRFEVEDDGAGMDEQRLKLLLDTEPQATSGVGLQNINRRLKFEYGQQLQITSLWNQGTKVALEIPR